MRGTLINKIIANSFMPVSILEDYRKIKETFIFSTSV